GKSNPDVLDVCQFCQTRLKPDSVLRIGQTPTKKNTGELESVLPDWLRDVRQQARDSAEAEAQAAAQSRPEKNEPPDLLAGLASQSGNAEEEEIPDWLASINPITKSKPAADSAYPSGSNTDFFAQFAASTDKPAPPAESPQTEAPSWTESLEDQPSAPAP